MLFAEAPAIQETGGKHLVHIIETHFFNYGLSVWACVMVSHIRVEMLPRESCPNATEALLVKNYDKNCSNLQSLCDLQLNSQFIWWRECIFCFSFEIMAHATLYYYCLSCFALQDNYFILLACWKKHWRMILRSLRWSDIIQFFPGKKNVWRNESAEATCQIVILTVMNPPLVKVISNRKRQ